MTDQDDDEFDPIADDEEIEVDAGEDEPELALCPFCDDCENLPLGQLGRRLHYRCRQCGCMYSQEAV